MTLFNSFKTALATYSIFPIKRVDWDSDKTKYSIGFFPFVGIILGALIYGWSYLATKYMFDQMIFSAGIIAIMILFTGGIHIDGFMDTMDAISSHQNREKKLEIMKDSHTGAFACIYACLYFTVLFAVLTSISKIALKRCCNRNIICLLVMIFVISRCLSGLLVLFTPNARNAGMLDYMTKSGQAGKDKIINFILLLIVFVAAALHLIFIELIAGAVILAAALLWALTYRIYMMKTLKGITGDTSGFFLTLCELFMICALYFAI